MERLTEQHYKKSDGHYMKCSEYCEKEGLRCDECKEFDELVDRLGVIEGILGDNYDLDRLRELVEADRDGRCEIHVAKDGGTVYSIFAYVNGLHIRKSNGEPITKIVPCVVDDFTRATVDREFGKTVFRTREDAEQALREWENKKENQQMGMGHRI